MALYYFDTCIWLDYYEKRGKNGENALKLILKVLENNNVILYSDLHIREFKKFGFCINEINLIFNIVKPDNIRHTHIHKEQIKEARKLTAERKIPFGDCIHAILTRDNAATLISTDKDFEKLVDVCKTNKPEEI